MPAVEAMLTTWPRPRESIRGTISLTPNITPLTLMSIIRWVVASSSSQIVWPTCMIPALLTRTSIGPSCASAPSRKSLTEARWVTSSWKATVPWPSSLAVCWAVAKSRSPIATFMPSRRKACAVARPMPRAAPVIAAT